MSGLLILFVKTIILAVPSVISGLLLVLITVRQWDDSPLLSFVAGLLFFAVLWLFDLSTIVFTGWGGASSVVLPQPGLLLKTEQLRRYGCDDFSLDGPLADPFGMRIGESLFWLEFLISGLIFALSIVMGLVMVANSVTVLLFDTNIVSWALRWGQ